MILAISAFAALVSMGNAAIGAAANIVPDAALICGFHLGVQGAALATVLSQGMSASFVIRYLCTDRSVLRLRLRNIRFSGKLEAPMAVYSAGNIARADAAEGESGDDQLQHLAASLWR